MKEDKPLDQKALKQVIQELAKIVGTLVDEDGFLDPKKEKIMRSTKRTTKRTIEEL
jgi:hypothetical protein